MGAPVAWLYEVAQSLAFLSALRQASIEILKHYGLPTSQGWKRYKRWTHKRPIGVIQHFTAGVTWTGSARWLNDGPHKNTTSCQILILDRMLPIAKEIYAKYPELKDIKATIIILCDFPFPACWHAGWVNRLLLGIEMRNAGPVRGTLNKWRWWANKWRAKFPHEKLDKYPLKIDGQWWEPYTYEQIYTNILFCQHLHCLYQKETYESDLVDDEPFGLDRRWVLPHSAVTGTKWDTGKAFPCDDVRDAIFAQMPIDGIPWLKNYKAAPTRFVEEMEAADDELFLMELEERQTDRRHGTLDWDQIVEMPPPDLQALVEDGNWKEDLPSVRRALSKLWYAVPGDDSHVLDVDTALATWIFQKSVSCKPYDKIPGGDTQEALHKRLRDFRLHT